MTTKIFASEAIGTGGRFPLLRLTRPVSDWLCRRRLRHFAARAPQHLLRDIGLTLGDVENLSANSASLESISKQRSGNW
jgi:uncharacterized protein YjiS (DUF1127 family)